MGRFAFVLQTALAFAVVGTECRLVLSQTTAAKPICKVYSLAGLGDDPGLGPWLAETIAAVIEPQTWKQPDGKCSVRYYAPRRLLVVAHTAAVQQQVQAFLGEVRKHPPQPSVSSAPVTRRELDCPDAHAGDGCVTAGCASVVPAVSLAYGNSTTNSAGYPVPPPVQQPKHLFHFVIRYEGPGDLNDNVVKAMQQAYGKKADGDDDDKKDESDDSKNKDDKTAALAPGQLPRHLLHFIIRYEGAGIIDDNVVKAMRLYAGKDEDKNTKGEEGASDECEDK